MPAHRSVYRLLLYVTVILLCVNFKITTGNGDINMLLVTFITLSPLMLLLPGCRKAMPRIDLPIGLFLLLLTTSALAIHYDNFRWISTAYTWGFCFLLAMAARLTAASQLSSNDASRLIRIIVYAFCVTLLIQQLCRIMGYPPVNLISDYNTSGWKLGALATEPSSMVMTLTVLMVFNACFCRMSNPDKGIIHDFKTHPWLWAAYCWCLFSTDNASAYVLFPIALLPWIRRKYIAQTTALACASMILITIAGNRTSNRQYNRVVNSVSSAFRPDENIIATDLSIAGRVVPTATICKELNPIHKSFWIGYGNDADTRLIKKTYPRYDDFASTGPFIVHLWYNYGFIVWLAELGFILTISFIYSKRVTWPATMLAILEMGHCNSPTLWLILTLMVLYRSMLHNE